MASCKTLNETKLTETKLETTPDIPSSECLTILDNCVVFGSIATETEQVDLDGRLVSQYDLAEWIITVGVRPNSEPNLPRAKQFERADTVGGDVAIFATWQLKYKYNVFECL